MNVTVRSGPATVLASGTATTFWGHDLEFRVEHPGFPFAITLGWVTDPDLDGVDVRTSWPEGGLRFDLVNFDGADGRGSADPVLITEIDNEFVFFHFRVFRYGRTADRTVHWCFFTAKRADVSWVVPPGEGG